MKKIIEKILFHMGFIVLRRKDVEYQAKCAYAVMAKLSHSGNEHGRGYFNGLGDCYSKLIDERDEK